MAQPTDALSAAENLVSSGTIPGGPLSVQGGAWIASNHANRPTASGCSGFRSSRRQPRLESSQLEAGKLRNDLPVQAFTFGAAFAACWRRPSGRGKTDRAGLRHPPADRLLHEILFKTTDAESPSRTGRSHMRFVVVNGRTPCRQSFCASCRAPIEASYLREIQTRLPYCDHDCYADHCEGAILAVESHARAS